MLQSYLLDTVPGLVPEDIKQRYPNDKTGQINTLLGKNPLLFDSYLTNAIEVDVDCLCDGKDSSFRASWSISRKPASTRATPPARCRCIRSARRWSTNWSVRRGARQGAECRRSDERAVRHQGRHHLCARSEPAGLHAPSPSSPRRSARRSPRSPPASWPANARRGDRRLWQEAGSAQPETYRRQGGRVPFARFPGVDTLLGPEMRSTGEVSARHHYALLCQVAARCGRRLRATGRFSFRFATETRNGCCPRSAFSRIIASRSWRPAQARFLGEQGIVQPRINKVLEGRPPCRGPIPNRQVHS